MPRPLGQSVHKHYSLARVHGEAPCDWLFFIPCQSLFFFLNEACGRKRRGSGRGLQFTGRCLPMTRKAARQAYGRERKKRARSRGDVQLSAVNCAVISRVEIVIYMAPFFLVALRFSRLWCNEIALDNLFCKRQRFSVGHNYTKLEELCLNTILRSKNIFISNKYTLLYVFLYVLFSWHSHTHV